MSETTRYALLLCVIGVAGLVAVLSNRLTARLKVPSPALILIAAAIAVQAFPSLHHPSFRVIEDVVTVALLCILFSGGMDIGWSRFRSATGAIAAVGVAGTFLTAGGGAVLLHWALGIDWYPALLVATAVAPTDPAVVFSVLGQREIAGRSGTILEGESGANDPVGIALMASLLSAGGLSGSALGSVAWNFVLQMVVGALIGLAAGRALLWFMRRVPLPSEALYPLRTLASVLVVYGVATVAHGSGFLAVFVAGIVLGDARAPYKREIERFHGALASLGEIVAFLVLGLSIDLPTLRHLDVWLPGLVLAVVLAFVVRPVMVGLCLFPARLRRAEAAFVLFAGLKGAVPILLGELLRESGVARADRLFGIVVVVVVFSVVVQGGLTPWAAHALRLPMHAVEPEPWSLGVRLRDEPAGVQQYVVAPGSIVDGRTLDELDVLGESAWLSFLVRRGRLVRISGSTRLIAGDEVLLLSDDANRAQLETAFGPPKQ